VIHIKFYKEANATQPFFEKDFKGTWEEYCAWSIRMRLIYHSAYIASQKVTGL